MIARPDRPSPSPRRALVADPRLPAHFSGTSKVFGRDPEHLAAIIRGLAADIIQFKIDAG
jgi:hypothetical protein